MEDLCIIDDGDNTNYIITLFFTLFYKNSGFNNHFLESTKNIKSIYLQELIKTKIIIPLKKNDSIIGTALNEIRNYCYLLGWKSLTILTDPFDIYDFYTFFMLTCGIDKIEIVNIDEDKSYNDYFINLIIDHDCHINELMNKWIKRFIIKNIPNLIPVKLTRVSCELLVDIPKKLLILDSSIKYFGGSTLRKKWRIHSIICQHSLNKFYSLVKSDNYWILFDDSLCPCKKYISLSDDKIIDKIKKECYIINYVID